MPTCVLEEIDDTEERKGNISKCLLRNFNNKLNGMAGHI